MPRLICGPMATLSHEAFRRSVERFGGCDEYFTEMINAPSLLNRGPFEQYYLLNGPSPEKIVWQLTGNRAGPLAEAAALVAERGGIGVDINMGCSAPQIYRTGAGIAWMTRPLEETREAVRAVRQALVPFPAMRLSVKCRLGDEDFTDGGFFAFTDMLADEGVQLITLHPRTRKEKSRGLPRHAYVEKLCLRYGGRLQVYLNGGVKDAGTLQAALAEAPHADGVMIARAAAQKPWLFAELKHTHIIEGNAGVLTDPADDSTDGPRVGPTDGPLKIDCQQLALDFIADVEACQPPEFYRTRLQRFFAYYCDNFSFAHYFKTKILNATSPDECRAQVLDYFARQSGDRYRPL